MAMAADKDKDTTITNIKTFESPFSASIHDMQTQLAGQNLNSNLDPVYHTTTTSTPLYPPPSSISFPVAATPASSFYTNSEGWSGPTGTDHPTWTKTNTKIYVVAYPSDLTSTFFAADASKPKVYSAGAGYGIFVEPRKVSGVRRLFSNTNRGRERRGSSGGGSSYADGEPTLFTVEGGGPAPGLTCRTGSKWGINGMLVRFLLDSRDGRRDGRVVGDVHRVLERIAGQTHCRAGDERWLKDALNALAQEGVIRETFYFEEFCAIARGVVVEQVEKGASWDNVLTIDWEDHIVGKADVA